MGFASEQGAVVSIKPAFAVKAPVLVEGFLENASRPAGGPDGGALELAGDPFGRGHGLAVVERDGPSLPDAVDHGRDRDEASSLEDVRLGDAAAVHLPLQPVEAVLHHKPMDGF